MAMLFSSKSISELISRAEYIQKISDFYRDLMQEYEDTVNQVKEKETQVQEEQAAIVELQQQSSDQQEAIQELYAAAYQGTPYLLSRAGRCKIQRECTGR